MALKRTKNSTCSETCFTCMSPQESEKAYFNPEGLVRALRDWEGHPLDVMVQQDASEFLTQFFQQVLVLML